MYLVQNKEEGEWREKIQSTEWIGYSFIKAKASDGNYVIFCVSNDPSNDKGFISFSVVYFYKYRRGTEEEKSILGFHITGREVDAFFNPIRVFEAELPDEDKKVLYTGVKVNTKNECTLGSYEYEGVNIAVTISAIPKLHFDSYTPLSAKSKIKFMFSEPVDLDFTIKVFEQCIKFFFYVCKRSNIQLNDIQVYKEIDSSCRVDGVIRVVSDYVEEELDVKQLKRIIRYDYLGEKSCLLFTAIANDSMYFEHLCSSTRQANSYGIDRIILNFVAFEREFRNLYRDDTSRSDEYHEVKEEVLGYLEGMKEKNTGKKKRYVKSLISLFNKTENKYGDRMKKALLDCEEILLPFLNYYYKDYKSEMLGEISERMNKLRNDSAHGNIDLEIKAVNLSDFNILEDLLYAMRLKHMGVELENIKKAIKDLKRYNIRLSGRD